MNQFEQSCQANFQQIVSQEYTEVANNPFFASQVKNGTLDFLQMAGASSDTPVSAQERICLGREVIECGNYSAKDMVTINRIATRAIMNALKV